MGQGFQIVFDHVRPPLQQGISAQAFQEDDPAPGGGAQANTVLIAGGAHNTAHCPQDLRMHMHLLRTIAQGQNILIIHHRGDGLGNLVDLEIIVVDLQFLIFRDVPEIEFHEETVELSRRQRVGAFKLDRVLGGNHEEELIQLIGLLPYRDLILRHTFQQGGLHLGGRAVDLVRQDDVAKQRSRLEDEILVTVVENVSADQVHRQQVRGKLDAFEHHMVFGRLRFPGMMPFDRIGQGFGHGGFPQSGEVFQKDMSPRHQAGQHLQHLGIFTPDNFPDILNQRIRFFLANFHLCRTDNACLAHLVFLVVIGNFSVFFIVWCHAPRGNRLFDAPRRECSIYILSGVTQSVTIFIRRGASNERSKVRLVKTLQRNPPRITAPEESAGCG